MSTLKTARIVVTSVALVALVGLVAVSAYADESFTISRFEWKNGGCVSVLGNGNEEVVNGVDSAGCSQMNGVTDVQVDITQAPDGTGFLARMAGKQMSANTCWYPTGAQAPVVCQNQ